MQRIAVVGTTGSGKTILARQLSRRLAIPLVELDALYWGPGWSETPTPLFRERVAMALQGAAWVVDGNYSKVRDLVWSRAHSLVWLDYALPVVMWRLIARTLARVATGEELWAGNRERVATALLSRESILLWALKTYRRYRREYPVLLGQPEYAHLSLVRLRSPRATRAWLSGLEAW
jgi:adenylate kinase family enzyme